MQERRTANMSRSRFVQVESSCKEHLNCEGKLDRLPRVAAELVHRKLDLILTASEVGALAAKMQPAPSPLSSLLLRTQLKVDLSPAWRGQAGTFR
jgi:hypothetical protein